MVPAGFLGNSEGPVKAGRCALLHPRHDVRVQVHRRGDGGVTESFLGYLGVGAGDGSNRPPAVAQHHPHRFAPSGPTRQEVRCSVPGTINAAPLVLVFLRTNVRSLGMPYTLRGRGVASEAWLVHRGGARTGSRSRSTSAWGDRCGSPRRQRSYGAALACACA